MLNCIYGHMFKSKLYSEDFLKDKKYNHLTWVGPILPPDENFARKGYWRCDCGKEVLANIWNVIHGRKKSCSCFMSRKKSGNHTWKGFGDITGAEWGMITKGAKLRELPVKISIKDAWELFLKQGRKCALTGEELHFNTSWRSRDRTASLDRIDSNKGYIKENVQWVHKDVNMMKQHYSQERFIEVCKKVTLARLNSFDTLSK
jgi:hypothetical protein